MRIVFGNLRGFFTFRECTEIGKINRGMRAIADELISMLWGSKIFEDTIMCDAEGEAKVRHPRGRTEALAATIYVPVKSARGYEAYGMKLPLPQKCQKRSPQADELMHTRFEGKS